MLGAAVLLVSAAATAAGAGWETLVPGLELRSGERSGAAVEALRVDPARFRLRVALASDLGRPSATVRELAVAAGATAAVNGGFFDPEWRPVGLRVRGGERVAGSVRRGLAALVVAGDGPRVVLGSELGSLAGVREAVQCGPRLVVGGRVNGLKPQAARRTAAGIDGAGRLVLLVTRTGLLDATDLAAWLAEPEARGGYGVVDALNLDGGGSSQLWVDAGGRRIEVAGATPVSDALLVLPRAGRR